jgi:4-diphosphocytidyl-2-C-methyl-D-erythritol kinase
VSPPPLRALAPAKINLGLFLGPVRADGRHELVTVMQSISLADELTLRVAADRATADRATADPATADPAAAADRVLCPGVPGSPEENLAARALAAFRAATGWDAPPLELSIDKHVPVAAGLGGGSGDAAAALRLAAAASGLGDRGLLEALARTLGADVPAQVQPGRWLARGAGEQLRALPDPVVPLGVLVLPIARALSTGAVYAEADRMGLVREGAEELEDRCRALADALADGSPVPPTELLRNDLEDAARALCPEIDAALLEARAAGADVALVSGSGPTVLGLFAGSRGPARARAATRALAERNPAPLTAEPVTAGFAHAVGLAVGHN